MLTSEIEYLEEEWNPADLVLGYDQGPTRFGFLPHENRVGKDKEDWCKLKDSIEKDGICKPLITYKQHVLVGTRRAEIAQILGIETVTVWRLTENIDEWDKKDMYRIKVLTMRIGEFEY